MIRRLHGDGSFKVCGNHKLVQVAERLFKDGDGGMWHQVPMKNGGYLCCVVPDESAMWGGGPWGGGPQGEYVVCEYVGKNPSRKGAVVYLHQCDER